MTAKALLPSTSVIAFTLGNGLSFTTFVNTVPINEHRTVNRFALVRKLSADRLGVFNWGAWDSIARQSMIKCASGRYAVLRHMPGMRSTAGWVVVWSVTMLTPSHQHAFPVMEHSAG